MLYRANYTIASPLRFFDLSPCVSRALEKKKIGEGNWFLVERKMLFIFTVVPPRRVQNVGPWADATLMGNEVDI